MKSSKTTIDHPEGIILRILSFLPITTSLQTSTIAHKWRNQSLPFRFHPRFLHVRLLLQLSGQISIWDIRQLFAEFISRILLQCHRHSPLEKFHLLFFDYVIYDSMMMRFYVNSWVQYATRSKGTEIELDLDSNVASCLSPVEVQKRVEDGRAIENADDDKYFYSNFHFFDLILFGGVCQVCIFLKQLTIFDILEQIIENYTPFHTLKKLETATVFTSV